jgi:hypothetical protein
LEDDNAWQDQGYGDEIKRVTIEKKDFNAAVFQQDLDVSVFGGMQKLAEILKSPCIATNNGSNLKTRLRYMCAPWMCV